MSEFRSRWKVLLLSAGHGSEILRDVARRSLEGLGFECVSYDSPDYAVDSALHSHAACLRAVEQYDIVVTLLGDRPGSRLSLSDLDPQFLGRLRDLAVVEPESDRCDDLIPSILQAEVLYARALDKTVILLMPKEIRERCHALLKAVTANQASLHPRGSTDIDPGSLIAERDWHRLHHNFHVETGSISFGQLVFLERMRKEAPNYVSYYDGDSSESLLHHLRGRVAGVPLALRPSHLESLRKRISRDRRPFASSESLVNLRASGLILSGPYDVDPPGNEDTTQLLAEDEEDLFGLELAAGHSTLVLGNAGLGKSTYLLLAAEKMTDAQDHGNPTLYATWRELSAVGVPSSADALIRTLVGLGAGKMPWPSALDLPNVRWRIIIDGLDESSIPTDLLIPLVENLRSFGTLLMSCREHDFQRRLSAIRSSFETIVRLTPWQGGDVCRYREALIRKGATSAAEYLNTIESGNFLSILSVPLWLTMITYLAGQQVRLQHNIERSEYRLLFECGRALAADELARRGISGQVDVGGLCRGWSLAAWEVSRSRRVLVGLREAVLFARLGIANEPHRQAVLSLLDMVGDEVVGFTHEVLLEYWLAEYIIAQLLLERDGTIYGLAESLATQRSVTTNRLVRQAIRSSGRSEDSALALREAFWQLEDDHVFAKNQLLYMLGRIDEGPATCRFLTSIWRNSREHPFVRYSAAYAAVIAGVPSIESEFYAELAAGSDLDSINRWYHRYYYGDISARPDAVPQLDDDDGPVHHAVSQLLKRLVRQEPRHFRLRRIELLTLRRFVETRGLAARHTEVRVVLEAIISESSRVQASEGFSNGVRYEVSRIREIMDSQGDYDATALVPNPID